MEELAKLIAKKFIQRRDVKAIQQAGGEYFPAMSGSHGTGERLPFRGRDIVAHLAGESTFGHYMLDTEDKCKLFAFDIDLRPPGTEQKPFMGKWAEFDTSIEDAWADRTIHDCPDLRAAWHNRKFPGRSWMKYQFRMISNMLARTTSEELGIPVAIAYSGNKGVHVYGFTGTISAAQAIEGAKIVLDTLGCFTTDRGKAFYKHVNEDPVDGYPNLSIEVFPKQETLDNKDLGNLMRLPLGVNRKHAADPTFFIDTSAPYTELKPHTDPIALLNSGNPWI